MSIAIRAATPEDIPGILSIYAPYVRETAISFEMDVPSEADFLQRFTSITQQFPWLVAVEENRIAGYAYASAPFARAAYQWNAELSVYIAPEYHRQGLGTRFYDRLEDILVRQGYVRAFGVLSASNTPSLRFHLLRGYEEEGRFRQVGYKLGAWHDVVWLAKNLREAGCSGLCPPVPWDGRDIGQEV